MFCPKCGRENPSSANFCAYCAFVMGRQDPEAGSPLQTLKPPKPPFYKRWWFITICAVAWFFMFWYVVGPHLADATSEANTRATLMAKTTVTTPTAVLTSTPRPTPESTPTQAPTPEPTPTLSPEPTPFTITITAKALIGEYEANEVKADNTYKGQTVTVSGFVDSIGKDILNDVYITIGLGGKYEVTKIQCMFKEQTEIDKVAELLAGNEVTVTGECSGRTLINVTLKNCSIND